MLTYFYFDSGLFDDMLLIETEQPNDIFLDKWRKYGCLHICKDNFKESVAAIKKINPKYVQKWQSALAYNTKKIIDSPAPKLSEYECIRHVYGELGNVSIQTGVVSHDFIELYEEKIIESQAFEIVSPSLIHRSASFNQSEELSNRSINKETSLEELWHSRISKLVSCSKSITFIDKFMIKNVIKDYKKGIQTSLEYLLEKVSEQSHEQITISIISGCDIDGEVTNFTEIKSYLNDVLYKKPYFKASLKLEVSLCKSSFFGKECHDRLLAIGNFVIEIGKGADIFRYESTDRNTFTIKNLSNTFFNQAYASLNRQREKVFRYNLD